MTNEDVFHSEKDIKNLTNALLDRSLPKARWTHAAHLAAAYELLHRHSADEVAERLPGIIRRYNEATDTPNTDQDGYHETITQFYIWAIGHFITSLPTGTDYLAGFHALINGPYGAADFPLRFYSKDRLFSVEARRQWLEPDLAILD